MAAYEIIVPVPGSPGTLSGLKTNGTTTVTAGTGATDLVSTHHHYLDLTSANTTATLTISATGITSTVVVTGTILIKQRAVAVCDLTIAAGGDITSIVWLGTEPAWTADTVAGFRIISYRSQGTVLFLAKSAEGI